MDIATTPRTLSPAGPAVTPAPGQQARSAAASATTLRADFDTFLRMLTAQIQNQDPLSPMKAEEFAAQLATFSGVEQQVYTNQLLEGLGTSMGQGDLSRMAAWVGMDARAVMPAWVDGGPVTVDPPIPIAGDRHNLVVTDADGAEVDRRMISGDGAQVTWPGRDRTGNAVPPGTYSFAIESFEGGKPVAFEPVETYAQVIEARSGRDGITLIFSGGTQVAADAVTALRRPGSDRI